jgi:hypothetical protein
MMKIVKNNMKSGNRAGYALLFAVLVAAVVLGVGVSILNIARKELLLTSSASQSQYAFYAADSGYECALYQDHYQNFFSTSTAANISGGTATTIACGVVSPNTSYSSKVSATRSPLVIGLGETDTFTFNVPISPTSSNGACAAISVVKTSTIDGATGNVTASTTVQSDGFNVGWENPSGGTGDCNGPGPGTPKVDRALQANY